MDAVVRDRFRMAIHLLGPALGVLMLASCTGLKIVSDWKPIGPGPIRDSGAGQINVPGGTVSGLVTDIAIDPRGAMDSIIYIATDAGGIWKSADGGQSWKAKSDFMPALSMGAVALDPSNPSVVYAGSGSLFNFGDFSASGVYKSRNGGDSWTILNPSGVFTPPASAIGINRIVLPNSNTVLVGTNIGLYRLSADGNKVAMPLSGVISDLKLDTASSNIVYAAVAGFGILKSSDSGATFASAPFFSAVSNGLPPGLSFSGIVFAQSTRPTSNTFYATAILTAGQPLVFCGGPFQNPTEGVYTSTDGGQTWSEIRQGPELVASLLTQGPFGAQTLGYATTLGVDPQDAKTFYFGLRGLYAATDGGANGLRDQNASGSTACPSKTQDNRIDNNKGHADHHAIAFSPPSHFKGARTRVFLGNDGGLASTADLGSTYSYLNTGLATILMTWLDIGRGSKANNVFSYGTAQDNGLFSRTPIQSGIEWLQGENSDGIAVAVDPIKASHALGADRQSFYTTVDGQNWTPSTQLPASVKPIVFDPNGQNVYAASGPELYQSRDNGRTFSALKAGFTQNISSIGQSKADSNIIWVGLSDGTLRVTRNALTSKPTWKAPDRQPGVSRSIAEVAVDPTDSNQVVVVYPGFSKVDALLSPSQHVFKTVDGGAAWSDISGVPSGGFDNLPDLPLYSVVIDRHTNPHTIIVAGDGGVFQTAGLGNIWTKLGSGLPNAQMMKLALDDSVRPEILRVASWGRSAFEIQLSPPSPPCGGTVNACGGCSALQAVPGAQCQERATGRCGFFKCVGTDSVSCDFAHGLKNACGGCSPMGVPGSGNGAPGDHCFCPTSLQDGILVCARDGNRLICCNCASAPGCGPGSP